jgi:hypothetical protein
VTVERRAHEPIRDGAANEKAFVTRSPEAQTMKTLLAIIALALAVAVMPASALAATAIEYGLIAG